MADVTIHDVDPELLKRLEQHAEENHRSVEEEIRALINASLPKGGMEELRRLSRESLDHFRGRFFSDSTELIREDRER